MADDISDVSISNSALIKLGVDTISSLSQDTKAARLCNARYAFIRNKVLEDYHWSFATKTVELAALASPSPRFDWTYAYQVPGDFLKMVRGEDWEVPFETVDGYLMSDDNPLKIKYVFKNTNTGTYSYSFAECVSWRLAADLAYALVNSKEVGIAMMQAYDVDLRAARYSDSQNKSPETPVVTSWTNVRN